MVKVSEEHVSLPLKKISSQNICLADLMPCNIEETDERLLLHSLQASKSFDKILTKMVDSYVIIRAVAAFTRISGLRVLRIEFGTGKALHFIPVHEMAPKSSKLEFRCFTIF